MVIFAGCVNTLEYAAHTNPYDKVFDDRGFKISLTSPMPTGDGQFIIHYSRIYSILDDFSSSSFTLTSASLLQGTTRPSSTDIELIKTGQKLGTSFTSIHTVSGSGVEIAGSHTLSLTAYAAFILEIEGTYNGNALVLHSNLGIFEP